MSWRSGQKTEHDKNKSNDRANTVFFIHHLKAILTIKYTKYDTIKAPNHKCFWNVYYQTEGIDVKCVLLQLVLRCLCDQSCTIKKHKMLPLCPFPGSQGKVSGPIASCSQSPSLWVPLLALCSHLITFQWRHAVLFIAEWCFFIRLCLFVALRSTEGFLPADVSSATLQKDG